MIIAIAGYANTHYIWVTGLPVVPLPRLIVVKPEGVVLGVRPNYYVPRYECSTCTVTVLPCAAVELPYSL